VREELNIFLSLEETKKLLCSEGYYPGSLMEYTGASYVVEQEVFWEMYLSLDLYHPATNTHVSDILFIFGEPLIVLDITNIAPEFDWEIITEYCFYCKFLYKDQIYFTSAFNCTVQGIDSFKRMFTTFNPYLFILP
jgi:hypothetical protein